MLQFSQNRKKEPRFTSHQFAFQQIRIVGDDQSYLICPLPTSQLLSATLVVYFPYFTITTCLTFYLAANLSEKTLKCWRLSTFGFSFLLIYRYFAASLVYNFIHTSDIILHSSFQYFLLHWNITNFSFNDLKFISRLMKKTFRFFP